MAQRQARRSAATALAASPNAPAVVAGFRARDSAVTAVRAEALALAGRSTDRDRDAEFAASGTVAEAVARYVVRGELFFASSNDLVYAFDYTLDTDFVVVDLSDAEVWDASTVATLDAVQKKYAERGIEVEFRGLEGASAQRLNRLSGRLGD